MRTKLSWILWVLAAALLLAGCVPRNVNSGVQAAWLERCADAKGWRFCFEVPPSTHEERVDNGFVGVRGREEQMLFGPWNSWTGRRWDGLVAVVSDADTLDSMATDAQLLAWAGIWDAAQRGRDIAAGQSASSLPRPYATRVLVDARGRRWAHGERRWRELNLPYTRVEQTYVTPVGEDGLKLEITFECSHPDPSCRFVERMISGVRWDRVDGG